MALATELEEYLGFRFAENPLLDHPTIDLLSHHLVQQGNARNEAEVR